ncbi:hypothetical protein CEXT_297071 [Caerostris extrusa]|uniref:Uncharacterized protein n=1 Tax=Caerostris extrusa TaxID=172846 RepID=A0AAV4MG13_CAEEX|nr:hypothetical protein CEXT_297071 [Caerostris extrusa]
MHGILLLIDTLDERSDVPRGLNNSTWEPWPPRSPGLKVVSSMPLILKSIVPFSSPSWVDGVTVTPLAFYTPLVLSRSEWNTPEPSRTNETDGRKEKISTESILILRGVQATETKSEFHKCGFDLPKGQAPRNGRAFGSGLKALCRRRFNFRQPFDSTIDHPGRLAEKKKEKGAPVAK